MDPHDYGRLRELFLAAIDMAAEERARFVAQACGDDASLRQELASLLAAHERPGTLLDGAPRSAAADPAPPASIGAYRIQRVLGEGGMGVVYLAEQDHPRRTVALKVVRPGIATPRTLRRFEHEVQVLARLHHPGIAQVYEAGQADAGHGPQPFFAI